jgi:phosphonate transport system substrate-binding protein
MTQARSHLLLSLALLLAAGCSMVQPTSAPLGTEQNPVKLALAPSTDPQKVLAAGQPLVRLLEAETGLRIKLSVPTSYSATIEAMGTHNVDIGWLAPLAYILARDRVGADLLAVHVRGGSTTSVGQIVVRADSGIADLKGLIGRRVAFADDGSIAAYHLPRALLAGEGIDVVAFLVESVQDGDDRVLLAVYDRQADGGAIRWTGVSGATGVSPIVGASARTRPADLAEQIRVVAQTDPAPNDVVGVRRGVPPEVSQKLRDGLIRAAASPSGAAALGELYGIDGLAPLTDADFAPLREAVRVLGLDLDAELSPRRPSLR